MSVDKFGRIAKTSDSSDGVSLAYVDKNFMRKYGENTLTGSINMSGNTLTNVADPVNSHDVATKSYIDERTGMVKENGAYMALDHINMRFKKIKNLGELTEPNGAANKNYVDILRGPFKFERGRYFADRDISMNNRRLEALPDPINPHEVVTKNQVDSIDKPFQYTGREFLATHSINRRLEGVGTPLEDQQAANKMYVDATVTATRAYVDDNKIIAPTLIGPKPIISVHAEEKTGLGNGNYEFSFGNGSSGGSTD